MTSWVEPLGLTLIHFCWQAVVIGLIVGLLLRCVSRQSATFRHFVACSGLGLIGFFPLLNFVFLWPQGTEKRSHLSGIVTSDGGGSILYEWVVGLWLLGVVCFALRWVFGHLQLRQLLADGTALNPNLERGVSRLIKLVGLAKPPKVLVCSRVDVPMVIGCFKPLILIPLAAVTRMSPEFLEWALIHELVHIRRWDPVIQKGQRLLETLFFFHPMVWWVSRRITLEREYACDEQVVALKGQPLRYARALTELESLRVSQLPQALALTDGSLLSRVKAVALRPASRNRNGVSGMWFMAPVLLLMVWAMGLFSLRVVDQMSQDSDLKISWIPAELKRFEAEFALAQKRHGIDANFLAIIALVESAGNPNARSATGARGLMQLMPATAEAIARTRNLGDFSPNYLDHPEVNIDFGAWFLSQNRLSLALEGDSDQGIGWLAAAYNGGPGLVRHYKQNQMPLPPDILAYKELVQGLWLDRHKSYSQVFNQWRNKIGGKGG